MMHIPGLEAADAHFAAASARRTSLELTLASAAKQQADASARRDVLVRKIAGGQKVAAPEFRACEEACRTAETQAAIISDALPAAIELVRRAKLAVDQVLIAEAQRLAAAASTKHAAAKQSLETAVEQERAAASAAEEATRFVSVASNRAAWGGRAPLAAKADFDPAELARKYSDPVARRNAIADAILAAV